MSSSLNINIEFSHIYIDENFSPEHVEAAHMTRKLIESLVRDGNSTSTVIMIDDLFPKDNLLNTREFLAWLDKQGVTPDKVVRESSLTMYVPQLIDSILENKLKKHLRKQYKNRGPTCPMLIAIWHLGRLGVWDIGMRKFDTVFSVLPERFKTAEERADIVINASKYLNLHQHIKRLYF